MTDTPEQDPPLTAQQEAAVRRALARAGGAEPMPEEVADRLDQVITDLAVERADAAPGAGPTALEHAPGRVVVPLDAAARRRRTRVRVLLGAAAVVVAGAVAAGIVSEESGGDDAMTASTTSDRPARGEEGDQADGAAGADAPGGGTAALREDDAAGDSAGVPDIGTLVEGRRVVTDQPLRRVQADRLRADLVALQATLPRPAKADYTAPTFTAPRSFVCQGATLGPGYFVAVEYDAKPAVVAFRPPVGASQVAEVLACGTGDVLHSTTLPAP